MLTSYGHVEIDFEGELINLTPSLINISALGTPKEIVADFGVLMACPCRITRFACALNVLQVCADKPLPIGYTGEVIYSERSNKFKYKPGKFKHTFSDILALAEHLMIHGVCGKLDDEEAEGEPIKEFNAYKFIEIAVIHLGMSQEEANNLTMTQFVRLMMTKYPKPVNENTGNKKENREMLEWFESQNPQAH